VVRNVRRPYIVDMTSGYQALSEKEKATLRLLIAGHDSKSLARHLGLSVHTVNERLRDARRKLGTSSSREAARLLREMEEQAPESFGDKSLGDASSPGTPQLSGQPARGGGNRRRTGWIAGGIVMSLALALFAFASLSGPAPVPTSTQSSAEVAAENATVQAAQAWLALVDRGDWNASWDATGQSFKSLNTLARWTEASERIRANLGAFRSRELITVNYAPAPPYGYWVIKFRAVYANRPDAIETLSLSWENDEWRVVGVTIG